MSEYWVSENMFCPCCGSSHISKTENNYPVGDMQCDICGEIFEQKPKKGILEKRFLMAHIKQ